MTQDDSKHDLRDSRFEALLTDAASTYRVPPEPPLERIWSGVEEQLFHAGPVRRGPGRWMLAAIAASLAIGVVAGRVSVRGPAGRSTAEPADGPRAASNADSRSAAAPYQRETEQFLGNTAVLLAALPRGGTAQQAPRLLPEQAAQLLTTTRLLLDSPVSTDPRMRDLLQDLELVLAQVARLQPRRQNTELTLITQTLNARDLVPRIRSAVTDLNFSDYPE